MQAFVGVGHAGFGDPGHGDAHRVRGTDPAEPLDGHVDALTEGVRPPGRQRGAGQRLHARRLEVTRWPVLQRRQCPLRGEHRHGEGVLPLGRGDR